MERARDAHVHVERAGPHKRVDRDVAVRSRRRRLERRWIEPLVALFQIRIRQDLIGSLIGLAVEGIVGAGHHVEMIA